MQAGPPEIQAATIYNVEKFFGWVANSSDFCALTNRGPEATTPSASV
jgi:ureidoacrylate peracid hydrolase